MKPKEISKDQVEPAFSPARLMPVLGFAYKSYLTRVLCYLQKASLRYAVAPPLREASPTYTCFLRSPLLIGMHEQGKAAYGDQTPKR